MSKLLFIGDNMLSEGLGIMSLSAYLKASGHEVDLTLLADHPDSGSLADYVRRCRPDLIGFSVMTPQVEQFRPVTRDLAQTTGIPIVWGGAHCMFMSDQVTGYEGVSYICIGEGEESLLDLMNRIRDKAPAEDIAGLWARRADGGWAMNPVGMLEPLDRYPSPDRQLYYDKYPLLAEMGVKRFITQRGCPYKCSYCFEPALSDMYDGKGKLVRRRPVADVIAEIKAVIARYPTRQIHFSDDTFNLNKKWVGEFCEAYGREIPLPFSCNISVQIIDEALVAKMKQAGCRGVVFGLETGVEETRFKILNKPIPDATYEETCRLLHKYGIMFMTNIMFALPNETLDHAIASIRFNRKLRPLGTKTCILKMYRGTKLADEAKAKGWAEAEGEFTFKARDVDGSHAHMENILWAGYLIVKVPGLARFARFLLTSRLARAIRPLILIQNIQDLIFFNITPWQALRYFWASRSAFMKGVASAQADTYAVPAPVAPGNIRPD